MLLAVQSLNEDSCNISIKIAVQDDAVGWAYMLMKLDEETNFSVFQPKERSSEISKYESKIANSINNAKSVIFFAVDNTLSTNNIVGYLCAEAYKNNRKNHTVTIGMGILESYCSRGIGSRLLVELLNHAKINNIKRVEAYIEESNHRSINLSKKFGFIVEGIKRKAIHMDDDTYQNEYLMALMIDSEST